jgi:hypothetical protein
MDHIYFSFILKVDKQIYNRKIIIKKSFYICITFDLIYTIKKKNNNNNKPNNKTDKWDKLSWLAINQYSQILKFCENSKIAFIVMKISLRLYLTTDLSYYSIICAFLT